MTIRLLVLDVDGVLSDGEARPLDLGLLARLAALNRASRQDSRHPAVTVCTGRPAPYVELLLQAIDGHRPAVYESGAGLYVPDGYQFLPHPDLGPDGSIEAVRRRLTDTLVKAGQAFFQPGKDHSLSIFPVEPGAIGPLADQVVAALGPLGTSVAVIPSVSCLNIMPRGIDKGTGLAILAEHTGIDPADMLGVGDSEGDLPFLSLVGHSAAPANAIPAVQQSVDYVSPHRTAEGLQDILAVFGLV